VHLDLAHAFVAVLEHAFVPLGVEHAGAGFQRHLLVQRAHGAAADAVGSGRRCTPAATCAAALGALDGAADAAQRVEVGVDGGDAELDRVEVLVGQLTSASTLCSSAACCTGRPLRP
jgi:hypothetical protein